MSIKEIRPRNQCKNYLLENGWTATLMKKEDFDNLFRSKKFADGPHLEGFGDGYGHPYNPHKQAFGKLDNGKVVFCETSKDLDELVTEDVEKDWSK